MTWVDAYVGVPFLRRGRGAQGWDCWGLVRHIFKERAGIELPAHDVDTFDWRRVSREMAPEALTSDWTQVEQGKEREMDVAILRSIHDGGFAGEFHVGLVVAQGLLLHAEEKVGTVCVPFGHLTIRDRIRRIHRHRQLA